MELMLPIESDNGAVLAGFTVEVVAFEDGEEKPLLVKPNTDFTDTFTAYDMDEHKVRSFDPYRTSVVLVKN